EKIVWSAVIFGTVLLAALGGVIISFLFLYQKKKYRHQQEVSQMRENFTREMLQSKSEIQEQTLQHVATEVHDSFIPTLSVINLELASVLPALVEPARTVIVDSKSLVKQLMIEMKNLSNTLNTEQISKKGFINTLEDYLERLKKTGYFNVNFVKEGDLYRFPANKGVILFRMCQEALNNIVKHACAKNIFIKVACQLNTFTILIKDDGIGFDKLAIESSVQKIDSTGLYNMKSRALALGAGFDIDSSPGKGTSITITLPVT
ncbi:MAG: ATP-binding protein, partial [Bacteroidota bacterium]